jgi:signal transduction histidine kinase
MLRRALPVLLVLAAAAADGAGSHRVAFYALLAAVPALAVAALDAFGEYLEGSSGGRALVSGLALALAVLGTAVRGQIPGEATVPAVAVSALAACLGLLACEAAVRVGRLALARQRPARTRREVAEQVAWRRAS